MTACPALPRPSPACRLLAPAHAAALALALATVPVLLAGCASSPADRATPAPVPASWGEPVPGWLAAAPADALARGPWWRLFGDPVLDQLAPQVAIDNQTVAGAAAAVDAARAAQREQRAGFFPTVSLNAGATRSGSRADPPQAGNEFRLGLGASWEPDLWGRVAGGVRAAGARVQASEADLAAATLSAQGAFVTDYLGLREAEAEIALLSSTVQAYERSRQITQHRYDAGLAPRTDVLQAQTQLANAQSDLAGVQRQHAQLRHALAVLAGRAPAQYAVPAGDWASTTVPSVPPGVPSTLLQRRPDIAAAERRVAAANADIGVARSAWFPSLTLSGSAGPSASRLSDLFDVQAITWSLGLSIAEDLFDGGVRAARVDAARAAWRQAVASYRQTTLAAFQDVEDQLSAADTLQQQEAARRTAAESATSTEEKMMNRYRAGQAGYGDVVQAQIASLSARRALLQASLSRQQAAVQLVLGLGGGWSADASGAPPGPASPGPGPAGAR